ncbi:TauD/TfdA family dioxygenase [Jhaorihella thermophila]|uniref:Taurine dioxygenase, alpha-ketoglutarate-dependent n=1 Tax=Jhaorihella thermophila TaxID=488547 RepID=A0A1H5THX6_9RHOB|nr:TauD/TfdA family dioxygenase [Jhaorihella thermophila]SEF62409.1 Taurine dioxygenase, alpha-ketoglutarate-dependent [Jhaorihella thermophila]
MIPKPAEKIHEFEWTDLETDQPYRRWREARLAAAETAQGLDPVEVRDLAAPTESERGELIRRCDSVNFAHYVARRPDDPEQVAPALRRFAEAFGLRIAEAHRSAGDQGIVALQPSEEEGKRGYIPYSTKPLKWHTDGYYNAPGERISAFVLHCVRAAGSGGENRILDPEILYIRLRDAHPDYLRALMHPQAMTIPENREPNGRLRPASVGPVFYPDPGTGRLQMRYTARTRSIEWRDDPTTRAAEAWLRDHLVRGDPLTCTLRLDAGQGILNNNVLHDRTGFDRAPDAAQSRLLYRVRFHNRIGGG